MNLMWTEPERMSERSDCERRKKRGDNKKIHIQLSENNEKWAIAIAKLIQSSDISINALINIDKLFCVSFSVLMWFDVVLFEMSAFACFVNYAKFFHCVRNFREECFETI